jgi:hypothetical protein
MDGECLDGKIGKVGTRGNPDDNELALSDATPQPVEVEVEGETRRWLVMLR